MILRRSVGLKKDEYSLDRKPVTKSDVANLLQAAGFSKSNPFYIVPQGRITALTNAKDGERLTLLKEIAGTRVYEEHRAESVKILEETELKRAKIDELVLAIKERLAELEEEKEELQAYQRLHRKGRLLEHVIYDREQREAVEQLQALEAEYKDVLAGQAQQQDLLEEQRSSIQLMEEQLVVLQGVLATLTADQESLAEEKAEQLRARAQLSLALDEVGREEPNCFNPQHLKGVEEEIVQAEGRLALLRPQIAETSGRLADLLQRQSSLEAQREAILARRGRAGQFRSKADRDRWIQRELAGLQETATLQDHQLGGLREEEASLRVRLADLEGVLAGMQVAQESRGKAAQEAQAAYHQARQRRDAGMDGRKELWRMQAKLEQSTEQLRQEEARAERHLASLLDPSTLQGLGAVERIVQRLGLQGRSHGPLWGLFKVDRVFRTAVETIAGGSLFHWVVDDDETASRILQEMQRERTGRVTFIPLNRLKQTTLPVLEPSMVRLVDQLTFEERFAPAMHHVFGKAVVVESLGDGAASMLARQHKLTALTLAGDRIDRKGALTGGYCDQKRSRMDALGRLQEWRDRHREHAQLLQDIQGKLGRADQQVTQALAEMSRLEGQRQVDELLAAGSAEIQARRRELTALQSILEAKQQGIQRLQTDLQKTRQSMVSLQDEQSHGLVSEADAGELEAINQQMLALLGEKKQPEDLLNQLRSEAQQLETKLSEQLYRRRAEMLEQQAKSSPEAYSRHRAMLEADMAHVTAVLERIDASLQEAIQGREEVQQEAASLRMALEKSRGHLEDEAKRGDAQAGRLARYLGRRTALLERREDAMARLRGIGTLSSTTLVFTPDDHAMIESLATQSASSILHELHQCQESLNAMAHVNKKAADQYASFTRQGQQLVERQDELERSARAIQDFIRVLDQRKDEAIERTFQQVAAAFSLVFQRLVPQGRAELVMLRGEGISTEKIFY